MDVRGAFKDRHQRIGEGHIGEAAFAELFAHPATAGVPFILETPDSRAADNRDIPLLKRLRASVAGAGVAAGAAAGAAGAAGARPGARVAS
jgi:deoxyribonuclease-4